ncbi:MAG: hypothetical protein GY904_07285 [Planctomycetaceae bacterium]|nr:hypothetical protein [Planctomycetaceae bacterium]
MKDVLRELFDNDERHMSFGRHVSKGDADAFGIRRRQNTNANRMNNRIAGTNMGRLGERIRGTNASRMSERIVQQRQAIASGASVGMPGSIGSITSAGINAAANQRAAQRNPGMSDQQSQELVDNSRKTVQSLDKLIRTVEEAGGTF